MNIHFSEPQHLAETFFSYLKRLVSLRKTTPYVAARIYDAVFPEYAGANPDSDFSDKQAS